MINEWVNGYPANIGDVEKLRAWVIEELGSVAFVRKSLDMECPYCDGYNATLYRQMYVNVPDVIICDCSVCQSVWTAEDYYGY